LGAGAGWRWGLKCDPLPVLLSAKSEAIRYLSRRDLLDEKVGSVERLWVLPEARRLAERQLPSGGWAYPAGNPKIRSRQDYNQLETFRVLRWLVEKFGMNRDSPAVSRAADFLFSFQTKDGDFRGIGGNQYVPYYSAAFMELLVKAGYSDDPRITSGFRWLISARQDDGGWAFPLRTRGKRLGPATFGGPTIEPDRTKPFSHLVTGIVLRAFAAHPAYRKSEEARVAGRLLASRFFQRDPYPDRGSPSFWTSFSFPFWFTDLLSALDSVSLLGLGREHPQVRRGLDWLAARQRKDGSWKLALRIMVREEERDLWMTLAISRVFRRVTELGKAQ
jgi:squalene-hopene cyclase-like protein